MGKGQKYHAHDYFSGSGLVSYAIANEFETVWSNDISERKAAVYRANLPSDVLHVGDVACVSGAGLPHAHLSWASFPCQDLSLAGKIEGITAPRSGLVWHWLRTIEEQEGKAPRVVCAENVQGLISSHGGKEYVSLHVALATLGYKVGAVLLNAEKWVPQSRPRVFVIGTRGDIPAELIGDGPSWMQPTAVVRAASKVNDFVWWHAPEPPKRTTFIDDIVEHGLVWNEARTAELITQKHLDKFIASKRLYATAYRRTRQGHQVTELRCDGVAGCLRTPQGGSSRQYIVKMDAETPVARLLTTREVARLMGAPDTFVLPDSYTDAYLAMGDAVAVPVASWLAKTFLLPLAEAAYDH